MYADERIAAPPQRTRGRRRQRHSSTARHRHHRPRRFPGRNFPSARPPNHLSGGSWPTLVHNHKNSILTTCAHIATADVFHQAITHQTFVASRSSYQLLIPQSWCLTAKWKCRRRALRCPIENDPRVNHQKLSANRGAIAQNLPKRRHERLTASDIKHLPHSQYRRRRPGALPSRHLLTVFACVAGIFCLIFGCASPS